MVLLTRRRRRSSSLADLTPFIADLGGDATVVGLYDVRTGVSTSAGVVDSWADVRASGGGPPLLGTTTTRPAFGLAGITSDGVDDFLRNSAVGRLNEITQDCGVAIIGTIPTTDTRLFEMSDVATTSGILAIRSVGTVRVDVSGTLSASAALAAGVRVYHSRRTGAGTVTAGVQVGAAAEVTASAAVAAVTMTRLTVAASRIDVPAGFSNVIVRAILIFKGDYAGKQTTVNTWAAANHGATL